MGNEPVSLKIDQGLVRGVLTKRIETEIITALGDPAELIGKVVETALREKVDLHGNKTKYSSDNKYDFIEILCKNAIHQMAKDTFQEWLETNKKAVKQAVLKELQRPSRQKTLAIAFMNAVEQSLSAKWNFTCNVDFKKRSDDY
jgi:hypothetical protein